MLRTILIKAGPVMTALEDIMSKAGYRITEPRRAVISVLEGEHAHLTPAEILKRGRRKHHALGHATVYRTLEVLTGLGAVRPLFMGGQEPRYMRMAGGHHHMVCSTCGKVIEFDTCSSGHLSEELLARYGFAVSSHLLEFYGTCRDCS